MEKTINNKTKFSKHIQAIVKNSNNKIKAKEVFDDIIQIIFNHVFSEMVQYHLNPHINYWVDPDLIIDIPKNKYSIENTKILLEATNTLMTLFKNSEPFTDIVSEIYDEYLGEVLGQFLTPTDIADLLAELNHMNQKAVKEKTTIGDDMGCGCGSLILASLRKIHAETKGALKHIEIIAMDMDMKMVQLCAIQIVIHCLGHDIEINNLKMYWANTLTLRSPKDNSFNVLALVWVQNPMVANKMKEQKIQEDKKEMQHE